MPSLRPATPADYDAYVRLFPELGVSDPIPPRERFAAELAPRALVAVDDRGRDRAHVVGWGLYEILDGAGYVRNLISDPAVRRTGVGRALMAEMRAKFVAAGAREWHLNVKPDNTAAIALYTACGLAPHHTGFVMRLPREVALPAPPPELALAELPAARDAEVEPRFALIHGQLASARAKTDRRVLAIVRGDEVRGVGVYMARVPGAFPFRLADPADLPAAAALLRPLAADPAAPWLQLTAEDDEPLHQALVALGAHLELAILHMVGPL